MKKEKSQSYERYASVEKVQRMFTQMGIELSAGRKKLRVIRDNSSITVYIPGGSVNISFSQKGGRP